MITYFPWSKNILTECLAEYDKKLTTLDLEFTAKCTYASCIYCDSRPDVGERHPNELNWRETNRFIQEASKLGLRWIYTCGLGEPLEDSRFDDLVEITAKNDIRISIFTNGTLIDQNKAKWLHDHRVCLILKLDTFKEETFDTILNKKGAASKIYKALKYLLKAGYGKNCISDYTDIAFSIVPTALTFNQKKNINQIEHVIKFAIDNNIFPSIGELERAGLVLEKKNYSVLGINNQDLSMLKQEVEKLLWKDYIRPICPTIITGLHIDNIGRCVIDKETGLNCKWFLLEEPMSYVVGDIRKDDIATLYEKVKTYRKEQFNKNGNGVRRCETIDYIFGGCGGNPKEIIKIAREHL